MCVTQLAIRGVDPMTLLSSTTSFSQLHELVVDGVTPEIATEIGKHLPKCKIRGV